MRIALICRPDFRSPRVLAESLQALFVDQGVEADLHFDGVALLNRLVPLRERPRHWFQRWDARLRLKLRHFISDRRLLRRLRQYDAVVFCECTPNGFWKGYFGVEQLRSALGKVPLIYHSVFYFRNAPKDTARWLTAEDYGTGRYVWHLAVSPISERRLPEVAPWCSVGLNLAPARISPHRKRGFTAILDFAHPEGDHWRSMVAETLEELGVPMRTLHGEYTFAEIRRIYEDGSIFFVQMAESFGVSIAENFAAGNFVFVPRPLPPLSWRLDVDPPADGSGRYGQSFRFFDTREELRAQLVALQAIYDPASTPLEVLADFETAYPHFHHGNSAHVSAFLRRVEANDFS